MTITCKGYAAKPLPSGEIQLTIEEAVCDVVEDRLSLDEVASLVGKTKRAVDKLSRRQRDPLPLRRGKGRPFGLRSEICAWLDAVPNHHLSAPQPRSDRQSVFC